MHAVCRETARSALSRIMSLLQAHKMHFSCPLFADLLSSRSARQLSQPRLPVIQLSVLHVGYPFDLPDPRAGILAYAALVYHLPLLIAFSVRQSTSFVWGGCMLFPLKSLTCDSYGIMQAWREGGYSDDLIVAAKCAEHGLKILCPSSAIFPQRCRDPFCMSSISTTAP